MYFISDATRRGKAPLMSAFPRQIRPFTEAKSATEDLVIGEGRSMVDLIRLYYPGAHIKNLSARFGFLDRDNKDRDYNPADTDPFVFSSDKSLALFRSEAHRLIAVLTAMWVDLGLPTVEDPDRKVTLPDVGIAWKAINPDNDQTDPTVQIIKKNIDVVRFIVSNVDIMKKACVVRTVSAGWWAVSYKGKTTSKLDYFRVSLNAHKRAFKTIIQSSKGQENMATYWQEYGDPLLSNCGYPFFSAEVDKAGNPISKIKVVELFKGIRKDRSSWADLLGKIDYRAGRYGMEGFPLTVAGLRRLQAGNKWIHQFKITPSGMRTAYDEKGINSIRVAWMVPYIYNVIMSPVSVVYKTIRMLLPGCGHGGEIKLLRAEHHKTWASGGKFHMAEADYTNYDRFIPVDIIRELALTVSEWTDDPEFWQQGSMYLFDDANLVWPDFSSLVDGNGYLFKPGQLGLMSGVKTTGDMGSLVNSVINAQALANSKNWSEDQLYDYLTMYVNAPAGSKYEYYHVQSDDTLLIDTSLDLLYHRGTHFDEAARLAGLKGSVELGDRFLMRHYTSGGDRPVPSRVWQNTISNETPPLNELIFLAGLSSRTDGLMGMKTVDPFSTGSTQHITLAEAKFTIEVMKSLKLFMGTEARFKSKLGLEICDTFLLQQGFIESQGGSLSKKWASTGDTKVKLDRTRSNISKLLAQQQLSVAMAGSDEKSTAAWLYELYKDRNVPSAALILEELIALDPSLNTKIEGLIAKEHAFFEYASKEVGVKPLNLSRI
jgi:hypothetical protein